MHPQPMWVHALEGAPRILAVNQAALALYGHSEAELLQMDMHQLVHAPSGNASALPLPLPCDALLQQHRHQDGRCLDVEVSTRPTRFAGASACQVVVNNVTGRLHSAREGTRTERARQLLSACNEALVRATSKPELLDGICRIALDIGGYRMAWVGMAREDVRQSIQPVAHAGRHPDCAAYVGALKLSWSLADANGHGPAGTAVRSGRAVVVRDVASAPSLRPFLAGLQALGVRALIALPLRRAERSLGVLCLYADEVLEPGAQEMQLLQDLASHLAC